MNAMPVIMDGRAYDVRIVYPSLKRGFELIEGENAGAMLSGRYERDLIGTEYAYTMQIKANPQNRADYDEFFHALSAPTATHTITMPYGQTVITFEARVISGEDEFEGTTNFEKRWDGLTVQFLPIQPQRSADA